MNLLWQIENEYGPMEYELGAPAKAYTKWAAQMAVGLGTGVPWVMCKQDDAPDPIVSITTSFLCENVDYIFLSSCHSHYQLFPCHVTSSLVGLLWDYMLVLNDIIFFSLMHMVGLCSLSLSHLYWSVCILWFLFEFCAGSLMTISPCLLKLLFCFMLHGLLWS